MNKEKACGPDIEIRTAAESLSRAGWQVSTRSACDYFTGQERALEAHCRDSQGRTLRLFACVDLFDCAWHSFADWQGVRLGISEALKEARA